MQMNNIPFGITDWSTIPQSEHAGISGKAFWRTQHFGEIRVRMVDYSPNPIIQNSAVSPASERE
jgi:hypothetical protein